MYTDQRYSSHAPRSISLGGALLVNGLVIAGLMSFVPIVVSTPPSEPIKIFDPVDPVPPPPKPEEKTEIQRPVQQPLPYVPPVVVTQPDRPVIAGSDILPIDSQPGPVEQPGPATVVEKPLPLPSLIGAQQDPRFAREFQPEYPTQELRAQRDGRVSIRVLIGTDGRVKAVEQVSATSPAFFEATRRQALAKWRFKPATRGGIPEESWKTMSVRFKLENA